MAYLKPNDQLLVVIGPSGSGKSTAVSQLSDRGFVTVTPSWTTRLPREYEAKKSIEHTFVTDDEFDAAKQQGLFLETVSLFGLSFRYALPKVKKPETNNVPLIMLRANLLPLLPRYYSNAIIYQIEDSFEHVKQRLHKRALSGEIQGSRLQDYEKEVSVGRAAAHRVFVNTNMPELVRSLIQVIAEDFA